MSIPELATQIIDKTLSERNEDNSRTLFVVGSKTVGKSTLLYSFLDKTDAPKQTLVLEYSFARKSNQKQGIEKNVCHVWEYGGKLDILKNVLSSVPLKGMSFFCIMIDLSKIKSIWSTIETSLKAVQDSYSGVENKPELIIVGGKYDLFKNYDSEIKRLICATLRSLALIYGAHLLFSSSKDSQLMKRAKDMCYNIGFGNGTPFKDKNTNYNKPLVIPKTSDTWESIGSAPLTIEQVKSQHLSRFPPEAETVLSDIITSEPQRTHPEPILDALADVKYKELRNLDNLDVTIDDYIINSLR